jgi:hypothetical protein
MVEHATSDSYFSIDIRGITDVWRSYTVRIVLALMGVNVGKIAERDARDDICRQSPTLTTAINMITERVYDQLKPLTFPESLLVDGQPKSQNQHMNDAKRIFQQCVKELVFLDLNIRLSRSRYEFCSPKVGKTVDNSWMEPSWCLRDVVTDRNGERKRKPTDIPVVILPVFPALIKSDGDDLISLAKAKVVPEWVPGQNDGLFTSFMSHFVRSRK